MTKKLKVAVANGPAIADLVEGMAPRLALKIRARVSRNPNWKTHLHVEAPITPNDCLAVKRAFRIPA